MVINRLIVAQGVMMNQHSFKLYCITVILLKMGLCVESHFQKAIDYRFASLQTELIMFKMHHFVLIEADQEYFITLESWVQVELFLLVNVSVN